MHDHKITVLADFFSNRAVDYVFVFGSYLSHPRPDSDVDILLNGNLSYAERLDMSLELEKLLQRPVDLVFVPEAGCEVFLEAVSKGKRLVVNNPEQLECDYFKNFRCYENTETLRRLKAKHFKEKYSNG